VVLAGVFTPVWRSASAVCGVFAAEVAGGEEAKFGACCIGGAGRGLCWVFEEERKHVGKADQQIVTKNDKRNNRFWPDWHVDLKLRD
jgi:hypothetical protein